MKKKLSKIVGVALTLALLSSMVLAAAPVAAGDGIWTKTKVPASGAGKALTTGTIGALGQSIDGTLFAVDSLGTGNKDLYKSTDGGRAWAATGFNVAVTITMIATSLSEANVLYVSDGADVWKSDDTGATFVVMAELGETITSIDATKLADNYVVVAGTSSGTTDVWTFDESVLFPTWVAQEVGSGAGSVLAVAFSPNFATDRAIVAVGSDATDTIVTTKVGSGAFGATIKNVNLKSAGTTEIDSAQAASIAFPDDFDYLTNNIFLVGVTGDGSPAGDVYRVYGSKTTSVALDRNIGGSGTDKQVHTVDVSGAASVANVVAGLTNGEVRYSTNGGTSFSKPKKHPSGSGNVNVSIGDDAAYAISVGDEGGFHKSTDSGKSWNGLSLIKTEISVVNDMSVTSDGTLYLATDNGSTDGSIWRHDGNWERVQTATLTATTKNRVEVSPDGTAVFVMEIDQTGITKSTDDGQIWTAQDTANKPAAILSWVVIDADTIITGAADDVVYKTDNNGLFWVAVTITGSPGDIVNFALDPDYDGSTYDHILAAGDAGDVSISKDAGVTWGKGSATGLTGTIYPFFHGEYNTADADGEGKYFATSSGGGVKRKDTTWVAIDDQGQDDEYPVAAASGVLVASNGTLYVADSTAGDGVYRTLNPEGSVASTALDIENPYWEQLTEYSTSGMSAQTLSGLWTASDSGEIWSMDTTGKALYSFTDTLSAPVTGIAVSVTTTTATVTLDDELLGGAKSYQLEVNTRDDFSSSTASGTITYYSYDKLSAKVTALTANKTYYYRVRVAGNGTVGTADEGAPVRSNWSAAASFTTKVGAPAAVATDLVPASGAQNVVLTPTFAWGKITGATYQLELATASDFTGATSVTTDVPYHTWASELEYSTAYYWRVRAVTTNSTGAWVTSVFTTKAAPTAAAPQATLVVTENPVPTIVVDVPPAEVNIPASPDITLQPPDVIVEIPAQTVTSIPPAQIVLPEAETPGYIWAIIAIGAVLVVAVIGLILKTRKTL